MNSSMHKQANRQLIRILIGKDLRLIARPVLCYLIGGLLAIGLLGVNDKSAFYGGAVLLISAIMGLGFHPCMSTVIGERRDHTLAFIMSMPITPSDYAWAKIGANLLIFFLPWALLLASVIGMILLRPNVPDGLIPLCSVIFGSLAVGALLVLCVAVVSESMQLTIGAQIVGNMLFQSVMYSASNTPAINATMRSDSVVWSQPALQFLAVEGAVCLLLLAATLWLQSRKTDFI